MLDNLPLVILDDADYAALFPCVSARCLSVLALCVLSFAGALCLNASDSWGVGGLVFGVSRHSMRERATDGDHFREVNPGAGVCVSYMLDTCGAWRTDAIASAGTYADSYGDRARFALVGFRWTRADRFCVDVSGGYYSGSAFRGVGFVPTMGVRAVGPLWFHVTGDPFADGADRVAFVALFARVHWQL